MVLVLATVFIIIIAAMADNRENQFETQITEQTQINVGIQNQIVTLEDENYQLKKDVGDLTTKVSDQEKAVTFYQTISQVYALALEGKPEEASKKLLEIDDSVLTEDQKTVYDTLKNQLQLPLEETEE